MTYVEESLSANEAVYYTARFPTVLYLSAWLLLLIGLVAGIACVGYGYPLVALLIVFCAIAAFCSILYRPWTTEIAITNLRLIYRRGLIQRRANDLQLRAIEEVQLRQNFWGRILNYGSIELRGTGVDDLTLPSLRDPVAIQKAVQQALGANQAALQLSGDMSIPPSAGSVDVPP
jgi:uncharacterized membrane protein YdbT with pleckstrin-like domain